MSVVAWACLHCSAGFRSVTTELECDTPSTCKADVHSAWMECPVCGWETRVVRDSEDRIYVTHARVSGIGNGRVGTA